MRHLDFRRRLARVCRTTGDPDVDQLTAEVEVEPVGHQADADSEVEPVGDQADADAEVAVRRR